MASYLELKGLFSDPDLMGKTQVAVIVAANNLISGTPSASETNWAAYAFSDPATEARKALMAVLAENKSASVATIQAATDTTLQNNVDGVVATLVAAYAAA